MEYSTGQVERLLEVPASTLRYWEHAVPLIQPRKDPFGRRLYSRADLRLLFRIRHLTLVRGLAISQAQAEVFRERHACPPELTAGLDSLRDEIIALFEKSRLLLSKIRKG